MSTEKIISKEEDMEKRSRIIDGDVPSECLDDPQFIKVLAASLCSDIATLQLVVNETDAGIKRLKENVTKGLEKRKGLKELTQELTKKKVVLSGAFESLERDGKHRTIEVETVKNRLDDATLREIADRAKFKKILEDYQQTWEKYKAAYEERPLAKERQKACITLKQLRGRLMMAEYEKQNLITMLKQRKKIDNIRVKASIVEISGRILQRWEDQSRIDHLNTIATQLQDKLNTYTSELSQLEQEEERKKRAEIEASMMPPPRLDFSFMRSIYNEQKHLLKKRYPRITSTRDADSMSVNTLMLEEMCNTMSNEEATETCRKRNQAAKEDDEESLNISTSVSVIQEPEPITPIANQADKTPASKSIVNQSDIQNKLKKLCIEKKTTFASDEKQRQRQAESITNNNNSENEGNDYEGGAEESQQRIRRWCEESQTKFVDFALRRRSNSFNERSEDGSTDDVSKSGRQKFAKASSIHGSEVRSLHQGKQERNFKNRALMEIDDDPSGAMDLENFRSNGKRMELQDQRKRRSGEKLRENTPIDARAFQSGERKLQNQIPSPVITTTASNQPNYETPQVTSPKEDDNVASQESKTSNDNLALPIDASCSRPKIRKIEAVNYPLEQRPKGTVVMNDSHQPDISHSPRQYVPSCLSSNFSNTFEIALQEMPQDSFCGESKTIPDFPSLSNWKNWSPPNSETSFASSISKIVQNKETPINEQHNPPKEQDQQFDFGDFFTMKPSQKPKNIF